MTLRARTDLTERQELALKFEALVEGVTVAEIRRRAIADYTDLLLDDPNCALFVRAALSYRREHGIGRPVTALRSIR